MFLYLILFNSIDSSNFICIFEYKIFDKLASYQFICMLSDISNTVLLSKQEIKLLMI